MSYGDRINNDIIINSNICGICIIDEIDAHLHLDLQYRALPQLMQLFPKVQFIMSSHSPVFVLGAEKILGLDNISIIEMPSGRFISSERYSEFGHAFKVFQDTQVYNQKIYEAANELIKAGTKPILITEGKTDILHLKKAMQVLEIKDIDVDFLDSVEEIGGHDNLLSLLVNRSRLPEERIIVGIFDRDEPEIIKKNECENDVYKSFGNNVYAICLPAINSNRYCSIEHYYPDTIIKKEKDSRRLFLGAEFYESGRSRDGNYITKTTIQKKIKVNGIIDEKVYKIDDLEQKNNLALTKKVFSEHISDDSFIGDFDFASFQAIFDRLRAIPGLSNAKAITDV